MELLRLKVRETGKKFFIAKISDGEGSSTLVVGNNEMASLTVYPNPANDKFFIEGKNLIERVVLMDLSGRVIIKELFMIQIHKLI